MAVLAVVVSCSTPTRSASAGCKGRLWIARPLPAGQHAAAGGAGLPAVLLAKEVGLYDTRLAVIIIFIVIQSAFGTYLLSSVLGTFPRAVLEAARMDGAGQWQVLWRVVVPDRAGPPSRCC